MHLCQIAVLVVLCLLTLYAIWYFFIAGRMLAIPHHIRAGHDGYGPDWRGDNVSVCHVEMDGDTYYMLIWKDMRGFWHDDEPLPGDRKVRLFTSYTHACVFVRQHKRMLLDDDYYRYLNDKEKAKYEVQNEL